MIFEGKVCDSDELFDTIKFRVACWSKALWPSAVVSVNDFICDPGISIVSKQVGSKSWSPPLEGGLKFNVDAAVDGSSDKAGIGGLLRNDKGVVFMLFSKSINSEFPLVAELLAVREACLLFLASKWNNRYSLTIESDCLNVVQWLSGISDIPLHLLQIVNPVLDLVCSNLVVVQHVPRVSNTEADRLAKSGVWRVSPLCLIFG